MAGFPGESSDSKPSGNRSLSSHHMFIAFAFKAKVGKEEEYERLSNNLEAGLRIANLRGAVRDTIFLGNDRMVRIFEFPDGGKPVTMTDLVRNDPKVKEFLRSDFV